MTKRSTAPVAVKPTGVLTDVSRIGVRILDGNRLTLINRTNNYTHVLPPDAAERWRRYLMAYGNQRYTGPRRGSKNDRSDTRLTGLFRTKREGLYVGSVKADQLDGLIGKIKEAKSSGKGLAFFLWKNSFGQGGNTPAFSLNVDVEKEQAQRSTRRGIEPSGPSFEDDDTGDDLFGDDK